MDNANPTVQALPEGGTLAESLTVTSADGTASETVTVTITGTNDLPNVQTIDAGTVTEDDAVQIIDLLAGQSDPDLGDTLSAANIVATDDLNNPVAFTDNGNGSISIDPSQFDALDNRREPNRYRDL